MGGGGGDAGQPVLGAAEAHVVQLLLQVIEGANGLVGEHVREGRGLGPLLAPAVPHCEQRGCDCLPGRGAGLGRGATATVREGDGDCVRPAVQKRGVGPSGGAERLLHGGQQASQAQRPAAEGLPHGTTGASCLCTRDDCVRKRWGQVVTPDCRLRTVAHGVEAS